MQTVRSLTWLIDSSIGCAEMGRAVRRTRQVKPGKVRFFISSSVSRCPDGPTLVILDTMNAGPTEDVAVAAPAPATPAVAAKPLEYDKSANLISRRQMNLFLLLIAV